MADAPLRLGLWGCGARMRALIENAVARGRVSVARCYDWDGDTAEGLARDYGGAAVRSEDDLLSADDVDAFMICLYPGFHAGALVKAMPVGKPIYTEKPIATTWDDFARVAKAARAHSQTPVHVGLMHRYCPVFAKLAELVRSGAVGEMMSVAVDWLCWMKPVESYAGGMDNWHFREDTGGELIQHYCHVFDWLRFLGGEFTHLTAMSNHIAHARIPIEDTWDICLRYESGAQVNFHSSMNNPRNTELGWIEGSEGALEWEWSAPSSIKLYKTGGPRKQPGETIPVDESGGGMTVKGVGIFLDNLAAGRPCDIDVWDGLWASYIPLMARKSAEKGRTVALDPFGSY